MRRIKAVVGYDGTCFAGMQEQGKGERTIQSVLETAVCAINGGETKVFAAGRTDSGVHAVGQVVHFDLGSSIPTDRIVTALNSALPDDISVRTACETDSRFHARYSAIGRRYVYLIYNHDARPVIWNRYSWWLSRSLDVEAMQVAASSIVGKRDFRSFANAGGNPGPTTVRDLRRFEIARIGNSPLLAIRAEANGFLRSMVRNLVGGLVMVGKGQLKAEELAVIADARDRQANPCQTAPPSGLFLLGVDYPQ